MLFGRHTREHASKGWGCGGLVGRFVGRLLSAGRQKPGRGPLSSHATNNTWSGLEPLEPRLLLSATLDAPPGRLRGRRRSRSRPNSAWRRRVPSRRWPSTRRHQTPSTSGQSTAASGSARRDAGRRRLTSSRRCRSALWPWIPMTRRSSSPARGTRVPKLASAGVTSESSRARTGETTGR